MRDAEAAFHRVAEHGRSLSSWIDFALANYREPARRKLLAEAVTQFVAAKQHEHEQDLLSEAHLVRLRRQLNRLQLQRQMNPKSKLKKKRAKLHQLKK